MHRRPSLYLVASAAAVATIVGLALHRAHATRPPETESSLRAALAADPQDAVAAQHLANLLVARGAGQEAARLFRTVMREAPDNAAAPVALAQLLDKGGQSVEAEKLLQDNLKRHPGDAATNEALADIALHSLGDIGPLAYPKIKPLYEAALRSDPARASAAISLAKIDVSQGDATAAGKVLARAISAGQGNDRNAQLHLALARALALSGNYSAASSHFDTGTALDPSNAQAFCDWGVMLIDARKPDLAEKVLRRAVELAPHNAAYHMHLGRALRDEDQFTASRDEFAAAIKSDSHYAPTYYEVSQSLVSLHQEQPAIAYLRDALREDPHYVEAKVALAKIYSNPADASDRNLWGAANLLREAVADAGGHDISLLVAAARALSAVDANDQALAQIEQALALAGAQHLSPAQREVLLGLKQDYLIATLPKSTEPLPAYLSAQVLGGDPLAEPEPRMPSFAQQFWRPMDITRPPGPGSVLDPEMFIEAAESPDAQHSTPVGAAP